MKIFNYFNEELNAPRKPFEDKKMAVVTVLFVTFLVMSAIFLMNYLITEISLLAIIGIASLVIALVFALPTHKLRSKKWAYECEMEAKATIEAFEKTEKKFGQRKVKAELLKYKEKTTKAKVEKVFEKAWVGILIGALSDIPMGIKMILISAAGLCALVAYLLNDTQKEKDYFYKAGLIFYEMEE